MTDAEIVELALRRTEAEATSSGYYRLILIADNIAKLLKEHRNAPPVSVSEPAGAPSEEDVARLKMTLDRYRYAVAWMDDTSEGRARLEWARRSDDGGYLSNDDMARMADLYATHWMALPNPPAGVNDSIATEGKK